MAIRTHIGKQEEAQEERSIQIRAADPGSPEQDQFWLNTTDKKIKFYDGVQTQETVTAAANATISTITANYTVLSADGFIRADAGSGAFTLTLPPAASNGGKIYSFYKVDSVNDVVIDPNGAELIDGKSSIKLSKQHQAIEIISNGVGWSIISSNISRYGKHVLSAAVNSNGAIADLTFNNLVIGFRYRVSGAISFKSDGTSGAEFRVEVKDGSTILATLPYSSDLGAPATSVAFFNIPFEAGNTSLTFEIAGIAGGHSVEGTIATTKTYAVLEENLMLQQTIEWD